MRSFYAVVILLVLTDRGFCRVLLDNTTTANCVDDGPKTFAGPKNDRQLAVVEAFKHSWNGYKKFAWGQDVLRPMSGSGYNTYGLGLTLIDSLDTMYIMNLQDEFLEARNWVEKHLALNSNYDASFFEVTIRVLGGLLSNYHLSGDKMFLDKAIELGNRLLPAFNTASGIPNTVINLGSSQSRTFFWANGKSSIAECGSIQLEFRDLSRSTRDQRFEYKAANVSLKLHNDAGNKGLVRTAIDIGTGKINSGRITFGPFGDSYYEYLLKQWIQTGKAADDYLIADYQLAIKGTIERLVKTSKGLLYVAELDDERIDAKMEHFVCFLPGTLALGYKNGMPESHLKLAKELLETCYQMYMQQPTFLAPERVVFRDNGMQSDEPTNNLRPELIESLFYFYVVTGNKKYQDMGWKIFNAFNNYTRVANGYVTIGNVGDSSKVQARDIMESFWLGETLKYFYLLFSDDRKEIDVDKFVFNTEAHLLPVRKC